LTLKDSTGKWTNEPINLSIPPMGPNEMNKFCVDLCLDIDRIIHLTSAMDCPDANESTKIEVNSKNLGKIHIFFSSNLNGQMERRKAKYSSPNNFFPSISNQFSLWPVPLHSSPTRPFSFWICAAAPQIHKFKFCHWKRIYSKNKILHWNQHRQNCSIQNHSKYKLKLIKFLK